MALLEYNENKITSPRTKEWLNKQLNKTDYILDNSLSTFIMMSTPAMSTDSSQVGVTLFPSF